MIANAPLALTVAHDTHKVATWFGKLNHSKPNTAHLHFYFHNNLLEEPDCSACHWGYDDRGVPNSFQHEMMIGWSTDKRARADFSPSSAGIEQPGLLKNMNLVFSESPLSITGRNMIYESRREIPTTDGTVVFRLSSGLAINGVIEVISFISQFFAWTLFHWNHQEMLWRSLTLKTKW